MGKLKIAIINVTGGGISGGYREYLRNVIPRIARHDHVESILCATHKSLKIQNWFNLNASVRFVNYKSSRFLSPTHDSGLLQELEAFSPNVIFVPVTRSFKFKKVPVVNMVQNMESFMSNIEGNSISERLKQWFQSVEGKRSIKRAERLISPSKFVVDFLENHMNISKEKIGLVYYGVNAKKSENCYRPQIIPKSWTNKFIFTAGSVRPARGVEDILQAIKHITSSSAGLEKLVIAGNINRSKTSRYQKRLRDWVQKNNLTDKICWAGNLNEKEMAWCYQNCQMFVMTSRVESFGMIAGEAMAHGCVCISADNPCLPEIFGDAAIYYQPLNGKYPASSIKQVLSWDNSQRDKARERARKQASRFSWDVCVERTVAQLSKATGFQE
jgi:glycosyltransferase involved in cell wall biosynthesis